MIRREKRVGNWRDFQVAPDAKKVSAEYLSSVQLFFVWVAITLHHFQIKAASYKEETRHEDKHGQVKLETWKKKWK